MCLSITSQNLSCPITCHENNPYFVNIHLPGSVLLWNLWNRCVNYCVPYLFNIYIWLFTVHCCKIMVKSLQTFLLIHRNTDFQFYCSASQRQIPDIFVMNKLTKLELNTDVFLCCHASSNNFLARNVDLLLCFFGIDSWQHTPVSYFEWCPICSFMVIDYLFLISHNLSALLTHLVFLKLYQVQCCQLIFRKPGALLVSPTQKRPVSICWLHAGISNNSNPLIPAPIRLNLPRSGFSTFALN
jgi:hypothetical protein